jgi:amino-acid N-acetyltransferase
MTPDVAAPPAYHRGVVVSPAVSVRRARTSDVPAIRRLVERYAGDRILLAKDLVTLYEDVPDFRVAVNATDTVVGCGALHVMWEDIAEVRTLAVEPTMRRHGIGRALVDELLGSAAQLGVARVFCLTFEVEFFAAQGFAPVDRVLLEPEVFAQMVRSWDEGIAEFLDLERVRPNTLGNTRMVAELGPHYRSDIG